MAKKEKLVEPIKMSFEKALKKIADTKVVAPKKEEKILLALHKGKLPIGDLELDCVVLENGTRILGKKSVFESFGRTSRGLDIPRQKEIKEHLDSILPNNALQQIPSFLDSKGLLSLINEEIIPLLQPIKYIDNDKELEGYNCELLPQLCSLYLEARRKKVLDRQQEKFAVQSEILLTSFAKVGLASLIDEVTGYQNVRDEKALREMLDRFLSPYQAAWAKRFPDEFYKLIFKLRGWVYSPTSIKRPSVIGNYTNDIVYSRMLPGVLEELEKINPKNNEWHRKSKHHQFFTEDIGHPTLQSHLQQVMVLMRAAKDWEEFYSLLNRALPKKSSIEDASLFPE